MGLCKKRIQTILIHILFIAGSINLLTAQEKTEASGQKIVYTAKQLSLRLTADDVQIVDAEEDGYHLYVRKTNGVNSILLTETTRDPTGKADNYAYRAMEYNPINGDEIRYLNGKPLISESSKYSLVTSTLEKHEEFGHAFHIYIPSKIQYGYEWSRNGIVEVGKGTFINIRTFEKPYADYTGDYMDSPFMFNFETRRVKKTKEEPPVIDDSVPFVLTDEYNPVASQLFEEISEAVIYSKGPESIIEDIESILDSLDKSGPFEVVFAIDATGSMKNDIEKLKSDMQPMLERTFKTAKDYKVGLVLYRDYGDGYNYRSLPIRVYGFTSNLNTFQKNINAVRIFGTEGGDIPEAVYEAVYGSCCFFNWNLAANKKIILIGDAEPHPTPRGSGKYSKEYVMSVAKEKEISVTAILLPSD